MYVKQRFYKSGSKSAKLLAYRLKKQVAIFQTKVNNKDLILSLLVFKFTKGNRGPKLDKRNHGRINKSAVSRL